MRRLLILLVVLIVASSACGDDASPFGTSGASTAPSDSAVTSAPETTATTGAETTAAPTTAAPTTAAPTTAASTTTTPTTAPTTTTTAAPTTTTAPLPTAADTLAAFFAAAVALDADIKGVAAQFNAGFDQNAGTLDPAVEAIVDSLDAGPLEDLIPAGLSLDLETAVLAVFADLDSRISAMAGGVRAVLYANDVDWAMDCLGLGGTSANRFDADLRHARELARLEPPPTAPADSPAAGVLEVRIRAIRSMNWGCESCGGVQIDQPIPVDWQARTLMGGVGFEANLIGGKWEILIYAC